MKRRWLAAVLVLLMVIGTVGMVAAEEVETSEEELQEEEGPPDFVIQMKELKAQQKGEDMEDEEDEEDDEGPPEFVRLMKEQKIAIMSKSKLKIHGNPFVSGLPPVIKEGRTLIPVGAVVRGLGANDVTWKDDGNIQTVTIIKNGEDGEIDIEIVLTIGELTYTVIKNGDTEVHTMDTKAEILGNRTFVPLKYIAEALGEKVKWNPEDKSINIGREFGQARAEEARMNDDDDDYDEDDEDDEDDDDNGEN